MTGDDIIAALLRDSGVYIHYTDSAGLDRILNEGVMRTDQKGYVYFTQEPLTQEEAHNNLFIGASTHAGRGTHILVIRLDMGMPVENCGYMELRVRQSVRLDQHYVIYNGANPFGAEL